MTHDKQNRPYAKLGDLAEGDIVTVDGDFTCVPPWSQHKVERDRLGLFIRCKDGEHHLASQQDGQGDYLTGIYKGVINQKDA